MPRTSLMLAAFALAVSAAPAGAADAAHGKALYAACFACHSEQPGALGPSLKGVVGRKAAALDDFRYSNAMRRAGFTWDEAALRDYVLNPQAKVKGNRMPFGGLKEAKDADDIVAYLKTMN